MKLANVGSRAAIVIDVSTAAVGMPRTPPRFLQVGNVLETRVEGIGRLRNRITPGAFS